MRSVILFLVLLVVQSNAFAIANEPTVQVTDFIAVPGNCNEIDLTFTPGDGMRRLIIARASLPVSTTPVDEVGYTGGSIYGTGTNLGNGNYVVYTGNAASVTISGLTGGVEYHFAIFEYNGVNQNANYLTSTYPTTTAIAPGLVIQATAFQNIICQDQSTTISVQGGISWTWSPSGTLSSAADSVVTASPVATTTYTVFATDEFGCSSQTTVTVAVQSPPNVSLNLFTSVCSNEGIVQLSGGSPSGGTYELNGNLSTEVNPALLSPGSTNTVTYFYSDNLGCSNSASQSFTVTEAPVASIIPFSPVCAGVSAYQLFGGLPSGGNYFGPGVSNNIFDPSSVGAGTYQISYAVTVNGCSDTATSSITVLPPPSVNLGSLPVTCANAGPLTLTQGSPAGGTYSGTGVNGTQFFPSVSGVGSFVISYSFTNANGCSASDTSTIAVIDNGSVTLNAFAPLCANQGPVALTGGNPVGGTYSGPGVSNGNIFTGIAGAGQHQIVYTVSANGCTSSATRTLTINPPPFPSLGPDTTICAGSDIVLTAGSNFQSYGWSTGSTSPSINVDTTGRGIGTFRFILAVSNNFGCTNRDTINVTFDLCTSIDESILQQIIVYPNPTAANFNFVSEKAVDMKVMDMNGRLMDYEKSVVSKTFGDKWPAGKYILYLTDGKKSYRRVLIKTSN